MPRIMQKNDVNKIQKVASESTEAYLKPDSGYFYLRFINV